MSDFQGTQTMISNLLAVITASVAIFLAVIVLPMSYAMGVYLDRHTHWRDGLILLAAGATGLLLLSLAGGLVYAAITLTGA